MKRERSTAMSLLLLASAIAGNAAANDVVPPSAWIKAVDVSGVPSDILFAMSLKESGTTFKGKRAYGPWPWVLNVKNEAMFFSTREEAEEALAAEVEKGNQSVAVGMYQIYLKYNGFRVDDVQDLVDPTVNLLTAAEVLKDCGDRFSRLEEKLSCYYSGDVDEAGVDYAKGVFKLAKQYGEPWVLRRKPSRVAELGDPEKVELEDHTEFLAMIERREKRSTRGPARTIVLGGTE